MIFHPRLLTGGSENSSQPVDWRPQWAIETKDYITVFTRIQVAVSHAEGPRLIHGPRKWFSGKFPQLSDKLRHLNHHHPRQLFGHRT